MRCALKDNCYTLRQGGLLVNCLLALVVYLAAPNCMAHDIGFTQNRLDVVQRDAYRYEVRWRSSNADLSFSLPKTCEATTALKTNFVVWQCKESLNGKSVEVQGLLLTNADVLVRLEHSNGFVQVSILSPQNTAIEFSTGQRLSNSVALNYGWLGIKHILLGYDHILFVLALMLIIAKRKALIQTITAFTVAHSLTLGLSVFGWVSVNAILVEVLIALSIVFLATEALKQKSGHAGLSSQKPWLVALGFGLLHGLGFANVLSELGLPKGEEVLALATFNLGVELGQVAFVLATWPILKRLFFKSLPQFVSAQAFTPSTNQVWPQALHTTLIYIIGSVAAFWFIQRVVQLYAPMF